MKTEIGNLSIFNNSSEHQTYSHTDLETEKVTKASEHEKPVGLEEKFDSPQLIKALKQEDHLLKAKLREYRKKYDTASEIFQESINHKRSISDSRDQAYHLRTMVERDLDEIRKHIPNYDRSLSILGRKADRAKDDLQELEEKKAFLLSERIKLINEFREKGLEHWVESALKDSVTPFMKDAFVEGTANFVEPVLDGLEKLASAQEDFSKRMSAELHERVPIAEKPFYVGFVTYTVLLVPLVLLMSVVFRLKRHLSSFTRSHFSLLMTGYFGLLSSGCFIATAFWSIDVLQMFREDFMHVFHFLMLLHGILFTLVIYHYFDVYNRTRTRGALRRALLVLTIGAHFVIHSYQHAMDGESPHVEMWIFLCYTLILVCIFYDRIRTPTFSSSHEQALTLQKFISQKNNFIHARSTDFPKLRKLQKKSFFCPNTPRESRKPVRFTEGINFVQVELGEEDGTDIVNQELIICRRKDRSA